MTDEELKKKLEKAERDLATARQQRTAAEHEEKVLQRKLKKLTRNQRTHRLCEQGAVLGAKLKEPDLLTADQVKAILDVAFSHSDVQEILKKCLEESN